MASSSSSSSCEYDVFLSFRGEDTRYNFTSHLYAALRLKKIKTFIDDEELRRGDEISPALLNAIEGSKISVIIFSKDYASSKWCLNELVKILQCHQMNGQMVIPVFYHVDPSDVRKQTGSFGDAFVEHENHFKETPEKVQNWRAALTQASNLSGWASKEIRSEAQLVDLIVKDSLMKLAKITVSTDSNGLVGLNSRIEQVKSLLCMEFSDVVQIVGLWGMGGIGKTTLATAIFNQFSVEFEGSCFLDDVRRKIETGAGLQDLQKQILSTIVDAEGPNISQFTKERVRHMKVFIVLDDVNKFGQLDVLIGGRDQFGPGSRILVTTRNKRVLENFGVEKIYRVDRLQVYEAFELFCNYAFRKTRCPEDLKMHSWRVVNYVKGNPLALKVLGSSLHRKSKTDWENALENLSAICSSDIYDFYDVLKISFNELTPKEKSIFLDIACFLVFEDKDFVANILDDSQSYGLNILIDKSLVTIAPHNKLQMHDLLQEMGRRIVCEESVKEPGKRSRLWHHKDICHVLKKNKGTEKIEGIFLDLCKIKDISLDSTAFANMPNLRLLKFYMSGHPFPLMNPKIHLHQDLEYLPNELRYLHWRRCPLKTLPSNFKPKNLIGLKLPQSKVEQLWEGKKKAFKLKYIRLSHSQHLIRMPDLSETPNLERANLEYCTNLSCIPSSIQNFNHLRELRLANCRSLRSFPSNIHFVSTATVDFSRCVNLTEFPQIYGKVIKLNLSDTAIEEVPSSIECLADLEMLFLHRCTRLKKLSTSIYKLKSLLLLSLRGSLNLEKLPKLEHLKYDCSERTSSTEFLSLIENLGGLDGFSGCRGLASLPSLSSGFSPLVWLDLSDCALREIPQDIGSLSSLKMLILSGNNFRSLPTSIKQLSQLQSLGLVHCSMLESIPELPLFLSDLYAIHCSRLLSLPEIPTCPEELDTSILDRLWNLSELHKDPPFKAKTWFFTNCMKLNEKDNNKILADSQLRIQQMAIASLGLLSERARSPPFGTIIYIPGSRIPGWFKHQSVGNSISIQLPPDYCVRNLIGIAFCTVLGFGGDRPNHMKIVENFCKIQVKIDSESVSDEIFSGDSQRLNSDHVVLGFYRFWNVRLPNDNRHRTVSLNVISDPYKVKCCGVCPVFANPIETNPNKFTLKFVAGTQIRSSDDNAGMSGTAAEKEPETSANNVGGGSDEAELEPSPKRTRR